MTKLRIILLAIGLVAVAALGATAWVIWHEPPPLPPSTSEEAYAAVMDTDPAALAEPDRDTWVETAGKLLDRLPPHEFEKLVQKTMSNAAWHARIASLDPEQRRKLIDLISEQKRLDMFLQIVEMVKKMPAPVRKVLMQQGSARMKRPGGHPNITKDQIIDRIAGSTPTQRAKFVRAMRELRQMAEEAGIEK